jgi:Flp pilus assembly protein TadB
VIPVLLAGAGVGFGLALMLSGLLPARTPLAVAAARLRRSAPAMRPPGAVATDRTEPALQRGLRLLARSLGLERLVERSVEADLRVVGSSLDDHVASRVLAAIVGLTLAPATAALMWAGRVDVSPAIPGLLSPVLGAAGFFVPTLTLRSQAAERRRSFRHALSSFLDLVSVTLAGGAGVETALYRSAETGSGWAFAELRHALITSQLLGQTPWAGLDRLGAELGVVELQELAASVALAGEDGASVRVSLSAKARALRIRCLSDTESDAQAATERMSLPIVVLMASFMIFVVYPAVARILSGL